MNENRVTITVENCSETNVVNRKQTLLIVEAIGQWLKRQWLWKILLLELNNLLFEQFTLCRLNNLLFERLQLNV